MKKELNDAQVEEVVGGTVIISANYMRVGFVTTKESYKLKNVTYRDARNYAEDLLDENRHLSDAQFDQLCKQKMAEKGWIDI